MEEGDPPDYPDGTMEFRLGTDDAWHPVQLEFTGDSLVVLLVEVVTGNDQEVHRFDEFNTLAELEAFRARFRPLSVSVEDVDCGEVQEGMTVCVTHDFSPDEWGYYDGVVKKVKRLEHDVVDEDNEVCHCSFRILWVHGPLAGTATSVRIQKINLILLDMETHPVLAEFFDKAMERFKGVCKRLGFMLDRAGRRRFGTLRGPEPSAFCKLPLPWEKETALCMPAIGARGEWTTPYDMPALSPPIYRMRGTWRTGIEFRSMKDDAWHRVTLRLTLSGMLVLFYEDYSMFGMQEPYEPEKFNTRGEIEDFWERFRPLSTRLTPSECGVVKVGDLVSVRLYVKETSEGKFYNSVVKEVVRFEHPVLDDQESCFCNFKIFWKHGPLGSTITTVITDEICLITPGITTHPALSSFLDSSLRELNHRRPKKRVRMGKQDPNVPPGSYAGGNCDDGGVTLSRGQPRKIDKGKEKYKEVV